MFQPFRRPGCPFPLDVYGNYINPGDFRVNSEWIAICMLSGRAATKPWEVREIGYRAVGIESQAVTNNIFIADSKQGLYVPFLLSTLLGESGRAWHLLQLCRIFGILCMILSNGGGEFEVRGVRHLLRVVFASKHSVWIIIQSPQRSRVYRTVVGWRRVAPRRAIRDERPQPKRWDNDASRECWIKRILPDPTPALPQSAVFDGGEMHAVRGYPPAAGEVEGVFRPDFNIDRHRSGLDMGTSATHAFMDRDNPRFSCSSI